MLNMLIVFTSQTHWSASVPVSHVDKCAPCNAVIYSLTINTSATYITLTDSNNPSFKLRITFPWREWK